MKRLLVALALAVSCLAVTSTAAVAADVDHVWVNGVVHDFTVVGEGSPNATGTVPLYVIAPVDPAAPLHPEADAELHGFGAHDHVIGMPDPHATFAPLCRLTLVVANASPFRGIRALARTTATPAGPKPLAYAVAVGPLTLPLESAAGIRAAAALGLVTTVPLPVVIDCVVAPV